MMMLFEHLKIEHNVYKYVPYTHTHTHTERDNLIYVIFDVDEMKQAWNRRHALI